MKLTTSTFIWRLVISIAAALAIAAAFPQTVSAQSDPLMGTWNLNLAKSTYRPGPPPRRSTITTQAAGQSLTSTFDGINAAGMPTHVVFTIIYDGQPHAVTGSGAVDASSIRRIDALKREYTNTKAGKVVATGTLVVSQDGRTLTIAGKGVNANGQPTDNIVVYEKQ